MFDIKNPNSFLGGQNVQNLIIIGLLIYIIFKLMKNSSEESGYIKKGDPCGKSAKCFCESGCDRYCKCLSTK